MSAQGVFTPEYRVEFIESEDCGDGTEFPLLVTLDQLAEILYRVRDAWFTAGELTYTLAGFPISISTADPPSVGAVRVVSEIVSGDITISARGYFAEETAIDAPWDDYFQDTYTPPYNAPEVRDVSDNERAIWIPTTGVVWGTNALEGQMFSSDVIWWGTAFAQYLYSFGDTSSSSEYRVTSTDAVTPSIRLSTPLEVAWFGGVSPFDPASTLYLKMKFELLSAGDLMVSSLVTDYPSGNLVIELAESSVQFPLYLSSYAEGLGAAVAYDFTITASEWWPYAKGIPETPVWDSLTGEKL